MMITDTEEQDAFHDPEESAAKETKPVERRYLVCVDNNSASHHALRYACHMARQRGGRVEILHVVEPADFSLFSVANVMKEENRQEAESFLKRLSEEAFEITGNVPALLVREGKTGDQIIAALEEEPGVSVLLLGITSGSAKHGKLAAWLTARLGESIHMPLLLIPGNLSSRDMELYA